MTQNVISGVIWQKIIESSSVYDVDPDLIGAFVLVESAGNTFAIRHEPEWSYILDVKDWAKKVGSSEPTELNGQMTSWGLMQIMGTVAREHGFDEWFPKLCVPELNLHYGIMHFKKKLQRFNSLEDAIASYNAGSPRRHKNGAYVNQAYVDKVLKFQRALKDSGNA